MLWRWWQVQRKLVDLYVHRIHDKRTAAVRHYVHLNRLLTNALTMALLKTGGVAKGQALVQPPKTTICSFNSPGLAGCRIRVPVPVPVGRLLAIVAARRRMPRADGMDPMGNSHRPPERLNDCRLPPPAVYANTLCVEEHVMRRSPHKVC